MSLWVDDETFARFKIRDYASRYDADYNPDSFATWPIARQIAFLSYVAQSVRDDVPFGAPTITDRQLSLYELYNGVLEANCGIYCGAFATLVSAIGVSTRQVSLATEDGRRHVGIEVRVGDKWLYVDVLFQFFAVEGERPLSASDLRDRLWMVRVWDEFYSAHARRYGACLSDYFYHIEVLS